MYNYKENKPTYFELVISQSLEHSFWFFFIGFNISSSCKTNSVNPKIKNQNKYQLIGKLQN